MTQMIKEKKSLLQALLNKRMAICIFIGFSSGLPLYVLIQFVPAWLRTHGVDLGTIGLFSLATSPYVFKFLWSPLLDRWTPPFLGRRRGWMLISQVLLLGLILSFSFFDPMKDLTSIVQLVSAIAFVSATQDIAIDAYRRELLPDDELGAGNGFGAQAYRLSSFIPGSLGLIISGLVSWEMANAVVAMFMLVGIVTTLLIPEPADDIRAPATLYEAVIGPFREFFLRNDVRSAFMFLGFLLLYKLGDTMATALETPFFLDMGFSPVEVGSVAKFSKTAGAIAGTVLGGIVMVKLGINRCLWIFGFFQIASILGYVALSMVGYDIYMLALASGFEYFGVGLGTVGLLAFMAKNSNKHFTATQFALFSSITTIPRVGASATTGFIIESVGYTQFFLICFLCAIPGMLMLFYIAPWNSKEEEQVTEEADTELSPSSK
ncbi:AmpG family muropeptide MFS transporter [Pleionea sp. CnH1-48]|uniref:AmpG family muropeptide MFS transporter n=1 Tax=Pleionea sp. CnH1-48 TaxID=2954494 RepID=UPI002098286A|nr:AmpG family muropeptide MFS transporter [Pleionea sp. CnH1-48]MCO7226806.1 AmpG family muropeptide MFS transporter [Pleionea sp. CnH1-48]